MLKRDESIAWAKIIENMLVIVDSEKVEKATGGEWKSAILRCLKYLLQDCGTCTNNKATLFFLMSILHRYHTASFVISHHVSNSRRCSVQPGRAFKRLGRFCRSASAC